MKLEEDSEFIRPFHMYIISRNFLLVIQSDASIFHNFML